MNIKKPIPDVDYKGIVSFLDEFAEESDRAAVILGTAKLDTLLYQLLVKVLLPSTSSRDDFLGENGALNTFSSRIHLAYRLGLVDAPFARALHLIRRIRNAFAHELSGSTLDSGPHRDRVKELFLPFNSLPRVRQFGKRYFDKNEPGPSADFRIVLAIMMLRLEAALLTSVPIEQKKTITLTLESWKEELKLGDDTGQEETEGRRAGKRSASRL
jgi:hypothetical protein